MGSYRSFRRGLDFKLAAGHNFNQQVLPFLKLFWPGLQAVQPDSPESRLGIDFVVPRSSGRLECAVCCRTFQGGKPKLEHLVRVEETIRAVSESDIRCRVLVVVHNADRSYPEFNNRVEVALKQASGRGSRIAEAWDRQTLVQRTSHKVLELLEEAFRRNSSELLHRQQRLFRFGRVYMRNVPVIGPKIVPRKFRRSSPEASTSPETRDVATFLRPSQESTWSVLTGPSGAGKTAAVLHAAGSLERVVVIVPSAALSAFEVPRSVSKFLEDLARSLGVFSPFEDVHDQELLYRLAGPVLAESLEREDSPYLLVVDGLDENRPALERERIEQVIRHLGSLRCQVVLTMPETPPEKFAETLKQFAAAKNHPRRLSLGAWSKSHMVELASQALRSATEKERQRIAEFVVLLQNDQFQPVYGDMPCLPLYLQMILEEVAECGIQPLNKAQLLRSWVSRRIRRAFGPARDLAPAMALLEDVAGQMISGDTGAFELAETLPLRSVQKLAGRRFQVGSEPSTPLLLGSVLLGEPPGPDANFNVSFPFGAVQAYFTASYLRRENLPASGYPDTVQELFQQLA
jgi:hypothetical protein